MLATSFYGDAIVLDFLRKPWLRDGNPVLDLYLRHVDVGSQIKRYGRLEGAVRIALALHVQHVLHAVYLLLYRRGDGVHYNLRGGAGVGCGHHHARWDDIRILRDRKPQIADGAEQG